jgi:hypothetical protein
MYAPSFSNTNCGLGKYFDEDTQYIEKPVYVNIRALIDVALSQFNPLSFREFLHVSVFGKFIIKVFENAIDKANTYFSYILFGF